ncbi:protein piccolo-like [Macrobrachium nipponense]|uniref:protein piccolo-like n=1 Tax=Macrobrachium nipponense TaxID=159736 RepID=UPI0030C89969
MNSPLKFKAKGHTVARCPNCHQSHHAWFRGCPVRLEKIWRIKGIAPPPARPQDRQPPPRRPPSQPRIDPRTNLPPPPQTPHSLNQQKPRHYIPNPSSFPSLQPPIPKPLPTSPTPKVIPSTPQFISSTPQVIPPAFASPTTPTPARVEAGTQTEQAPVEDMQFETTTEAPVLYAEAGTQIEDFTPKKDMEIQTCKAKLKSVASGSEFRFVGEQGINKLLMTYDEFNAFIHRALADKHYTFNERLFTEIFQEAPNFEISLPDDFLQSEFRFRTPQRQLPILQ